MSDLVQESDLMPRPAEPGISGLGLHLIYALAGAGVCLYLYLTITVEIPVPVLVLLLLGLWLWATVDPASLAPLVLCVLAIMMRLLSTTGTGEDSLDFTALMLGALLPITHQLAALAAGIPARSKFEWSAIRPTVVRCAVAVSAVELLLFVLVLA